MQPTRDRYGFVTETVSPHTPAPATAYTVQWSSRADFSDVGVAGSAAGAYSIPAIVGDGVNVGCHVGCAHTIGLEIQNVTVAAAAGTFALLYVGPQSQRVYALVQDGSAQVRLLSHNVAAAANDFLRIAGGLYQVKAVSANDPTALTLTAPFTGGFTDIAQVPHACLSPYTSSHHALLMKPPPPPPSPPRVGGVAGVLRAEPQRAAAAGDRHLGAGAGLPGRADARHVPALPGTHTTPCHAMLYPFMVAT